MGFLIYIIFHIACAYLAYRLFWNEWLNKYEEITRNDRRFFIFLSFAGPVSLLAASIITLLERPNRPDEVIYRKPKK